MWAHVCVCVCACVCACVRVCDTVTKSIRSSNLEEGCRIHLGGRRMCQVNRNEIDSIGPSEVGGVNGRD